MQKELENPKVLQQILQQSVADVESKFRSSVSPASSANRSPQGLSLPRRNKHLHIEPAKREISYVLPTYLSVHTHLVP